ncbi:DNA repair protein endonuclease SAE2/CtIP C-terminus-domain-containing protein [Irpex lacteus]|nr:DNA repair protein endonuclease SAE2/CtIP C-terminus-domain-containing protein [Irpex lacteus]
MSAHIYFSSKISLNSRFRLNPAHNEGLNFQFEEVVRHKHDRSKLDAEDCECCREYYSALAPLPLPAQPPLWRSPPTTPQKKRKYDTFDSDEEPENTTSLSRSVKQHVQKVSRHRRRWEAPKTPPGYWDIGFPDTQQTEEINKRAREMHADKLRNAEAEARQVVCVDICRIVAQLAWTELVENTFVDDQALCPRHLLVLNPLLTCPVLSHPKTFSARYLPPLRYYPHFSSGFHSLCPTSCSERLTWIVAIFTSDCIYSWTVT